MKKIRSAVIGVGVAVGAVLVTAAPAAAGPQQSVAREWNELLLESIRNDFARPTVHARNLFHTSLAMYDAWAAYDDVADQWLHHERQDAVDVHAAREEAISFAVYRLLIHRFTGSPGEDDVLPLYDDLMDALGYDKDFTSTVGDTPAALGNRIAESIISFGLLDGANEQGGYGNLFYEPVNEPLLPALPGNPDISDPNRWQPLALEFFIDQSGNIIIGGYPGFLSPEWGIVTSFALSPDDLVVNHRDGFDYWVFHDPGPPPLIGGVGDDFYRWGFELVSIWQSHHDPDDGVIWDISPASIGNAQLPEPGEMEDFYDLFGGNDWGEGYAVNPVTGRPYAPNFAKRGDYARILAEFWADGPQSETPPGHWFTILNYVADHPLFEKRWAGTGPIMDDLEWDTKAYLLLGGTMHDVAIACWGTKGWYDFIRPVSAIRYMADQGQSSDDQLPSYDPNGIRLYPGYIELVTEQTIMPGERHEHLAGKNDENVGKIALYTWRGPDYIVDPETDIAGVGWILAENWWPYQRPTFVSPPFAGYYSGHSTYSRSAAHTMTLLTGTRYFPGGLGEFECPQNEFLVFEDGPSQDVTLQWASYFDASDQCSLSRIWGGIHPPADDIPGRRVGNIIGPDDWWAANRYYNGQISCPSDFNGTRVVDVDDLLQILINWEEENPLLDTDGSGLVDVGDLLNVLTEWGRCPK